MMLITQQIIPLAGFSILYSVFITYSGHEYRTRAFTLPFTGPFYSNNGIGFQRFRLSVTVYSYVLFLFLNPLIELAS
jgi:hypothetical protein